jgi:hypothetical protein
VPPLTCVDTVDTGTGSMAKSFAHDRRRCRNRRFPFVVDKKDPPGCGLP